MILFIIFIIIPLIELSLFSIIGEEIGLSTTLLLCLLTALIGGFVVRRQGLDTLMRGQRALRDGFLPIEELFDGFCIVIAGSMLFTPGFFTDAMGFALLIPPIRQLLRRELSKHMEIVTEASAQQYGRTSQGDIIDGDYERVDTPEQLNDNGKNDDRP